MIEITKARPKSIHDEIKNLEKQQQEIFLRANGKDDKLALAATSEQLKSKTIRAKIEGEMAPIVIEINKPSHFEGAKVFDALDDLEFLAVIMKECIARLNRIDPTEEDKMFHGRLNSFIDDMRL